MSRLAVGLTAGFYMPAPVNSAAKVAQAVLGAYPVPAVFLVFETLVVFSMARESAQAAAVSSIKSEHVHGRDLSVLVVELEKSYSDWNSQRCA